VSDEPQQAYPPATPVNGEYLEYPTGVRRFRRLGPGIPTAGDGPQVARPAEANLAGPGRRG
jgi:hypothetical protein